MSKKHGIGKIALSLAISDNNEQKIIEAYSSKGYKLVKGHVGTMDASKIFAAIETAAGRQKMIEENYHEEHALYHAISEAFNGYCRGPVALDNVLRTTGLVFSVVRGSLSVDDKKNGDWIAVVLYGFIGSPRQGFEHEAIGLGVQSI
ncbi:MAG: hut operon transcriptional regulator HutP [Clostridiales bacterium]|nr:hut operon transcriptional regulator HutP [Clostridiales bacterium]